jgi:hypothetical protein
MNLLPVEVFVPCAEDIGKRRDYRSLQHLLQSIRENGYTDNKLHDQIIETCIRQTGSDVEQVKEKQKKNIFIFYFLFLESRTRYNNSIDSQ